MKKILSFLMALTMVLGLNAAPVALKQQKAPKSTSRMELVQKLKTAQPVTHQTAVKHAPKNVRHIDRTVMRKAPMADGVTFTFASLADANKTISGVTLAIAQGSGTSTPAWNDNSKHLRIYANNTITISGSGITKIELTFGKTKASAAYAGLSASTGSLVSGGESTDVGDFKTDTWTGTADEVVFTLGASGQRAVEKIVVYTDGDTPTPPTPPTPTGDVEITGLNYVDAIYYDGYWDFDFYNDYNYEEYYYIYPEVYFMCDEEAPSGTSIVGTYTAMYAGYWKSDSDSIEADAEEPVGTVTVTCVEQGIYNFVGSFVGTDGKTYTWTLNNIEVYAYDGESYEDITLTDGGDGPTPVGDTTALTTLDAIEFGYYGSYSTEGAYNYTLVLYNSQDDNYVPQVGLDIYTEVKDEFTGNFTADGDNLGLEFSAFFPTADSEGESFTDASVTITEGEGDDLVVEGIFTTVAGKTYTFSVTAEPYIYDAEHPYEPQEAKTFDLTAVEGELDEAYFAEYGLVYYYLYMEDGSVVGLTYRTAEGTQPEGTFAISDEEGVDAFLTGMDFYGYADGSYYETVEGDVYYFVSGSVTLATDELGNITITANATSVYGSTFTVTGVIGGKQPSGDHTIVIADYADVSFTTLDGAYTVASSQNGGTSAPTYNGTSEDIRLYAQNTFTLTKNTKDGPMTKIIFYISDKGLTRQAEIAVTTGEIVSYDMTNALVTWTGEASEVVFTVGDKNVYGSDGKTKAGQFDFTAIDIEGGTTGLISTKANNVASKCFINGQLMIIKDGKQYNVLGVAF